MGTPSSRRTQRATTRCRETWQQQGLIVLVGRRSRTGCIRVEQARVVGRPEDVGTFIRVDGLGLS